jgi:hypothetical protein
MLIRRNRTRVVLSVLVVTALGQIVVAQPPDVLRRYRVIPRLSSLTQTGGIAGLHFEYDLRGRFGLVTGYTQDPVVDSPLPVLVPYAKFVSVDVDAQLNHPAAFAAPVPLDYFVDLEQLWSFYDTLPVLNFRGKDAQGAPFKLQAVTRGPLIRLRGETQPICCDFFHFELDVLAYRAPFGDYNFDGSVDTSDYTVWRDTFGSTTNLAADGNSDGVVDHADYELWAGDVGTSVDFDEFNAYFEAAVGGASLAAASISAGAVPEPAALGLLVGGVLASMSQLRRRRS